METCEIFWARWLKCRTTEQTQESFKDTGTSISHRRRSNERVHNLIVYQETSTLQTETSGKSLKADHVSNPSRRSSWKNSVEDQSSRLFPTLTS